MTPAPPIHLPRLFSALAAGLLAASALSAATYLPISDAELAARAPVIVRARVVSQDKSLDTSDGPEIVVTRTSFEALEVLKGRMDSDSFQIGLPGGELGGVSTWIAGTPAFVVESEVVLFLSPPPAPGGDFSLTEFALSKFDVLEDGAARRFAVRTAFDRGEDDYLSGRSSVVLSGGPGSRRLYRDADSFLLGLQSFARGLEPAETLYAEPEGELRHAGGARPLWVNIGGSENSGSLYRWFWDTGASPPALVSTVGKQTGLSDGSDGLSSVANGVAQWSGIAGAVVRYSQSSGSSAVVVNLDVESKSPYWTNALSCTAGGVIGLGGPGAVSSAGSFKGDPGYYAAKSGSVWMRKVTGGCYSSQTFRTAVMHELGHTLGLGHSDQATSTHSTTAASDWASAVMVSSVPPSRPSTPQPDDIEAILWYYGSGSAPVAAPAASFTIFPNPATAGQVVQFADTSSGSPSSWSWSFGDGGASSVRNPSYAYAMAGTYTVTLTAANSGGSSAKSLSVTVLPAAAPPSAGFSFSPSAPLAGAPVQFQDLSSGGATSWAWDFGDPAAGPANFSSLANPKHVFSSPGSFTVTLSAFNASGSSRVNRVLTVSGCVAGPGALCLNNGRFRAEVFWRVPSQAMSGTGNAVPITGDAGYFWFFSSNNVELIVKVLDGRAINGEFWVFYGALSDVEYTLKVTDVRTGAVRTYFNPQGNLASAADTFAFAGDTDPGAPETGPVPSTEPPQDAACSDATTLCVNRSRFRVRVSWSAPSQGTSGNGTPVPLTSDTGYFWFFNAANPELVIKVVDGTAFNGRFWVFSGALSDVEYTITVTDAATGAVKTYQNPSGKLESLVDTSAF